MKYYPSWFDFHPCEIKQPNEINIDSLGRPAEQSEIIGGEEKN